MPSADETQSAEESAKAGADRSDPSEPAWPPVEARPEELSPAGGTDESGKTVAPAAPAEESILTKPAEPEPDQTNSAETHSAEAKPPETEGGAWEEKASEPKQEMGLSESTLHWLVDGEQAIEPHDNEPGTGPVYDSRAPVAGRKRTVAVVGGAAVVALVIVALLHFQAAGHQTAAPLAEVEPASVLTQRAETALSAGRAGEAMDLAHLAISANARFADAYVVVGKVQRASGRLTEARDAYRKYLELAPIGTHAREARDALAALPP
jgi:tetratricopeptide (TPR) repeat protein